MTQPPNAYIAALGLGVIAAMCLFLSRGPD